MLNKQWARAINAIKRWNRWQRQKQYQTKSVEFYCERRLTTWIALMSTAASGIRAEISNKKQTHASNADRLLLLIHRKVLQSNRYTVQIAPLCGFNCVKCMLCWNWRSHDAKRSEAQWMRRTATPTFDPNCHCFCSIRSEFIRYDWHREWHRLFGLSHWLGKLPWHLFNDCSIELMWVDLTRNRNE